MIETKDGTKRMMELFAEKVGQQDLPKIAGLPPFYQIQIETRYECNLRCPMCPNSYMAENVPFWGQEMSWELFKKIIAELKELEFKGRITLYLSNEPLLDERIMDMIAYTRQEMPDNRINTSTNGVLLTPEILDKLFDAGLTDLDISCYSEESWKKWLPFSSNKVKPYNLIYGENRDFWNNRGGNIEEGDKEKIGKGICWRPLIQLYVCSSGECIPCCSDFKREIVLGNLNDQTISEVWDSDKYYEYRSKMFGEREELELCNVCNYSGV